MKARFIGTSGGSITADDPSSSILIENGGRYLLIDIGSGVLMELIRLGLIDKVNDVLITHFHADHTADAGVAVHDRLIKMQLGLLDTPLTFWTLGSPKQKDLVIEGCSEVNTVKAGMKLEIAGMDIELFSSEHPVECLGVKVSDGRKTLYYTSDGAYSDELVGNIGKSDVVVAECSLYRDVPGKPIGHMNALDVAQLRKRIDAETIYLTHLPIYGNNEELLAPAREQGLTGMRLAEKGLVIDLEEN